MEEEEERRRAMLARVSAPTTEQKGILAAAGRWQHQQVN